jgi:predicted Zn-dependent protease
MPRLRSSLPALLALVLAAGAHLLVPGAASAAEETGGSTSSAPKEVTPPKETKATRDSEAARQRHQQILQQVGRYDDERLQQYVNEIGQRVAAKSDRPDLTYTFTVLDDDQINAFADPGGYIYVYRGLLAHLSSEAELAATLGHEIGHVTARHSARRQAGAVASAIGATLVGVLTGNAGLMSAADMAGGAMVMGYSREQESEADQLGMKFVGRAGYEPTAMIGTLEVLWDNDQYQLQKAREEHRDVSGRGGLYASHPDTDKRVREASAQASNYKVSGVQPRPANGDDYLARIDGLVVGTSGAQGVVRGSRFYHAGLGITLAFPSDWKIDNQPSKLMAYGPGEDRVVEVSAQPIPPNMTAKAFLGRLMQGQASTTAEPLEFNGLAGYRANIRNARMPWGNNGPVAVAVVYNNGLAYVFVGATRIASQFNTFEPVFVSSLKTFRRLRDNEYAAAEPQRIRLIKAGPDTKIAQLAQNAPNPKLAAERLRLLNGLYPDKEPTPGQILKVVE